MVMEPDKPDESSGMFRPHAGFRAASITSRAPQSGSPAVQRRSRSTVRAVTPRLRARLSFQMGIEIAAKAEMIKTQHAAGNPTATQKLPQE
jgi:hypothetical protein